MHTVTFYPIGNADCCQLILNSGQRLLFDYANCRNPNDPYDRRIDLEATLRGELEVARRDSFDVVAFTHADADHTAGAADLFYLDHAAKYQGEGRIKIAELWVPAAMIVESDLEDDARVLQSEARYRLKKGSAIRVFSRPARLESWLNENGLSLAERRHLITDAGQWVPGYRTDMHGVAFFVHSPFASRLNGELVDRNDCSFMVQATFDQRTRLLLTADVTHEVLSEIVAVTQYHGNEERLAWDILNTAHHTSYLSLSSDRGKEVTEPVPNVRWLLEAQGASRGIIVSTSWPIPAEDTTQPPHRQAANYYKMCAKAINGEWHVTMEHPTQGDPQPLVIALDAWGATVQKRTRRSTEAITSRQAPRAG